jgi:hypothetical protein
MSTRTPGPAELAFLDDAARRLDAIGKTLSSFDKGTRRALRRELFEAFQAVSAARAGEAPFAEAEAALEALIEYEPETEVPAFSPIVEPMDVDLITGSIRWGLVDETMDRYRHDVDVDRFVASIFDRLPEHVVRAFERDDEEREEPVRESYELVWKRLGRAMPDRDGSRGR